MLPPPRTLRRRHRVARRRRPPRRHGEERLRRMRLRRTRPLYPESRPTARAGYSSSRLPSLAHLLTIFVQRGGQPATFSPRCRLGKSVAPTNHRDEPLPVRGALCAVPWATATAVTVPAKLTNRSAPPVTVTPVLVYP